MVTLRCSTRRGKLRNSLTGIARSNHIYSYSPFRTPPHHWFDSARPKPRA
jgi:hypothetical protein